MTDLSVSGDSDVWMLLERQSSEGYPMVVRSRVGNNHIVEFEIQHGFSAIVCELNEDLVGNDGMPNCLNLLHQIEDDLISKMETNSSECFHTASVTGDGCRTMYFAHSSDAKIENIVKNMPLQIGELRVFSDLDLDTYREFITPSEIDKHIDGDRRVLAKLESDGDKSEISRKVDFWFYGNSLNLQKLIPMLEDFGLTIDHWLEDPVGVVMSGNFSAEIASFRELTPNLVNISRSVSVEYDGWETFVAKESNSLSPNPVSKWPSLISKFFKKKS